MRKSWPLWAALGTLAVLASIVTVAILVPAGARSDAPTRPCAAYATVGTAVLDAKRNMEIAVANTDAAKHAYNFGEGDYATYQAALAISVPAGKTYGDLAAKLRGVARPAECAALISAGQHVIDAYARSHITTDKASAQAEIDTARADWDRLATTATG